MHDSYRPTLADLEALIGPDLAAQLSAARGGQRIYLPHDPTPDCPLARIVGLDAAQKIAAIYGGEHCDVAQTLGRRRRAAALRRGGLSVAGVASTIGVTERHAYRLLADTPPDTRQMDLFAEPEGEA